MKQFFQLIKNLKIQTLFCYNTEAIIRNANSDKENLTQMIHEQC